MFLSYDTSEGHAATCTRRGCSMPLRHADVAGQGQFWVGHAADCLIFSLRSHIDYRWAVHGWRSRWRLVEGRLSEHPFCCN